MKRLPFLTATLSLLGVCLLYIPSSWADGRQTMSAGRAHTLIIGDSNTLWAWGDNDLGQVGDGSTTDRVIPARIAILAEGETEEAVGWRYLSAGGQHSAAIRLDGTLWVWGDKQFGQLGQGLDISGNQPTPLQVGSDTDWDAVSAGESHTLALKASGSLWTWGSNALGEAGIGSVASNVLLPVQISQAGEVWVAIAAGQNSSAAIRSDGTLWTWGSNANGQLGIGSIIEVVDGTFINNTFKGLPTQVGSDTDWAQIAVGDQHMLALKTGRTLWAWGLNNFNQVSPSNDIQILSPTQVGTDSDWTLISAGQLHSMALKSNGSLFGMGSNLSGQIGLGTVPNASVMTLVSAETNWIDVSAGSLFTVLRRNDGLVRSTGDNSQGQLGNRSTDSRTGFGDASFGFPDLTISAVAIATADPAPGTSITVNVFLLNEGSAAVPANSNLMVNLRLSLDTVYNSLDDSLLGTFTFNGAVGSGRGTTVAGNIDLPAEFDVGDFFVVARVDIGGALRELSETNNTGSSVVTISYFPDLSGSFANIDPGMGSQVNRGQPLNFDFVVTNSGNARIPEDPEGVFTLNVFLSEDQFLGADDLALIENQSIADAFAASQTRSFAQMVMIPLFTPLGSYFLIGQIDTGTPQLPELDLENNIIITAIPEVEVIGITITEAVDDPVAELEDDQGQIVRTDIEFSTGGAGQWFGQTVEFQRDGDAAQSPPLEAGEQSFVEAVVPGPSAVTFKWKVSSQRIENFLQITIDGAEPILDGRISGDVDWIQVTHILPANTNQLRWTYVQGAYGDGTETAYLDDVTVADLTGSDLVIESVSFRAGIYVPQRDILGLTVLGRNQGEEAQLTNLPSVFMVDVFLSLDRLVGNDDDIFIGTLVRFQDLDPDDRFGYRATRPIPGDTAPGQYFVAVIVDSTNVIPEFNESNNAFLSETADVTVEPRPDLVPLAVSFNPFFPDPESDDFPGFFLQSEIIELTFTIQNVGLADAPADPFNINIVLSDDREIGDSTDAILLTLPEISGLPVGQTRTYNVTVEIPPETPTGEYFSLGIVVDSDNAIVESVEENNSLGSDDRNLFFAEVGIREALDILPTIELSNQPEGLDAPFYGQTGITFDGVDAAQSGVIADEEIAGFEVVVSTPNPEESAVIAFNWKVSSENNTGDRMMCSSLSSMASIRIQLKVKLTGGPSDLSFHRGHTPCGGNTAKTT